ncbi:uncharacterized protein Bfra_005362 [Botrytis fragariae]|uniref:Uncharacterized protein n=1 Tax=Botrytis fragariae TaxID=1964551 RepID=A0A8H6AUV1_9HELO|nr:uncharacterized protein Bfra_005362 [Botrytis fragariae]KAF5873895.1 hypothetical protein Bfra_005362 [Botrytis fragariae]
MASRVPRTYAFVDAGDTGERLRLKLNHDQHDGFKSRFLTSVALSKRGLELGGSKQNRQAFFMSKCRRLVHFRTRSHIFSCPFLHHYRRYLVMIRC